MLCLSYILQAQISGTRYKVIKKSDTTKVQTLKTAPPNTYTPQPPTPPVQITDMNALLPDIKIVSFKINYLNSQEVNGELKHTYEIAYLLKNEGNISVSADSIGVQGFISYQMPFPTTSTACGALINSFPGLILNPGATHRGSYKCTSKIDKSNNPVYILYVDYNNIVRELNEQNNKEQMPITF